MKRRDFLLAGAGCAAALASGHADAEPCLLNSEQEIGPFYLDLANMRRDITEGKPGIPLVLRLTVMDATRCIPLEKVALDIWHCDALGFYSGFTASNPDGPMGGPGGQRGERPPGPPPPFDGDGPATRGPGFARRPSDKTTFLRGIQLTDSRGVVEFATIYPGWYISRDIHIHIRVHVGGSGSDGKYTGGHISHTGQLFFPDGVSDRVAKLAPYASHRVRRTRQDEDHVFLGDRDPGAILTLKPAHSGSLTDGFLAEAVLGVDPRATPKARGLGPGQPPGPPS